MLSEEEKVQLEYHRSTPAVHGVSDTSHSKDANKNHFINRLDGSNRQRSLVLSH